MVKAFRYLLLLLLLLTAPLPARAVAGWDAHFAMTGWGHYVYVFDVNSAKLIRRLGPLPTVVSKLAFSRDGTKLAAGLWGTGGLTASDGAGVVMFASSAGREVSYESAEWGNGAFTAALLQILADPQAYGDDGKLSISELDEELTTRVERLTGGKQTPVMTKPGAIKRFFVAAL